MTITVSTADPRSVKALAVLANADRWQRGHLKSGRSFYAVPSSADPNRFYLVDCRECTCPDFTRRGVACKHVLAVRLRVAQLAAESKPEARRASKPAAVPAASIPDTFTTAPPVDGTSAELACRDRSVTLFRELFGHDGEGS